MSSSDLPARYRSLQPEAGYALTEAQSRGISIPLTLFAAGGLALFWWLSHDQLKRDRAARAKTRRNPRRRR